MITFFYGFNLGSLIGTFILKVIPLISIICVVWIVIRYNKLRNIRKNHM